MADVKPPHPLSFAGFLESWERVFRFLESCGIHNYEELQERLKQIQAEVKRG